MRGLKISVPLCTLWVWGRRRPSPRSFRRRRSGPVRPGPEWACTQPAGFGPPPSGSAPCTPWSLFVWKRPGRICENYLQHGTIWDQTHNYKPSCKPSFRAQKVRKWHFCSNCENIGTIGPFGDDFWRLRFSVGKFEQRCHFLTFWALQDGFFRFFRKMTSSHFFIQSP